MSMKLSVLFLLFFTFSTVAKALSDFRTYQEQIWEFETKLNYFKATGNYQPTGNTFDDLPNGGKYSLLDLDLNLRKPVTSRWAVYSGVRVSQAESVDTTQTRTNSSLSQVMIGSDLLLLKARLSLIPDIFLTIPTKRIDTGSDLVMNHEGAIEAHGRLIARLDFSFLKTSAYIGGAYRDEGRSSFLTYGASGEVPIGKWSLGAGLYGYNTLLYDDSTNNSAAKEIFAKNKNGGSLKFYSVNPSLLDSQYWLGYNHKKWALQFGGGFTIAGASSAAGWNAFASLLYRFQSTTSEPSLQKLDLEKFEEKTDDGVDQKLFEPEVIQKLPPPPPKAKSINKRRQIKQNLDDAEMQIELKNTRKKRRK